MFGQIKFSGHIISSFTLVFLIPCAILAILFSQIQISSARTALGDGADSGIAQEQPTPQAIDQVDAADATEYEEQSAPASPDQVDAASSTTVYLVDNRLLGQGLDIWNMNIYNASTAQYQAVAVATGLRGPANGFVGDFYNWEDPYGVLDSRRRQGALASSLQDAASVDPLSSSEARAMQDGPASAAATVGEYLNPIGTLDYLRAGQDKGLITIVNSRGYPNWFAWPGSDNPYVYSGLDELKSLAAEWILYTHYTVKHFSAGHEPSSSSPDPLERDSAQILDKIRWQNPNNTQPRPTLPAPGERLPELSYWEIGNEPNYHLTTVFFDADHYLARYGVVNGSQVVDGITNHIIAQDKSIHDGRQTIKVGPSLMGPEKSEGFFPYTSILQNNHATVNFVSYHPYNKIFGTWASKKITLSTSCYKIPAGTPYIYRNYTYSSTSELPDKASDWTGSHIAYLQKNIREIQLYQYTWANSAEASSSGAELLATEWNPGDSWSSFNLTWRSKSMAHVLASMESVFSFARSGVTQAYYYTYPGYGETNNPTYKTFQFLKDHLGTQMVKIYPVDNPTYLTNYNYRGYVTTYPGRGTARGDIILWGLNWGDTDININFQVTNLSNLFTYTLSTKYRLAAPTLLHGDVGNANETCAPLPTQELPITQVGVSSPTWSNGQISLSVPVSKYSWVAYVIKRTPKSPFYNLRTPFLFNFSSQSQAAAAAEYTTPSLSPYPAPEAEPGGWEANPADREGIPYP